MSDDFRIGDFVQEKSGGPYMRVSQVDDVKRRIIVQWTVGDIPHSARFSFDDVIQYFGSAQRLS